MLFSAETTTIKLDDERRVIVIDQNATRFAVCPSYGLGIHTHNDTLATILCKDLGLGDSGIAEDAPILPELALVKALNVTPDLNVTVGDKVDNCGAGINRSLAINCFSKYNSYFKLELV